MKSRKLNSKEYKLLSFLLKEVSDYSFDIKDIDVLDMNDGGMGSIYFVDNLKKEDRAMSKSIIEREFIDEDEIPISVSLNIDQNGKLFELDIWKVNFEKIKRYPTGF